jgi:hypothetical protein
MAKVTTSDGVEEQPHEKILTWRDTEAEVAVSFRPKGRGLVGSEHGRD